MGRLDPSLPGGPTRRTHCVTHPVTHTLAARCQQGDQAGQEGRGSNQTGQRSAAQRDTSCLSKRKEGKKGHKKKTKWSAHRQGMAKVAPRPVCRIPTSPMRQQHSVGEAVKHVEKLSSRLQLPAANKRDKTSPGWPVVITAKSVHETNLGNDDHD